MIQPDIIVVDKPKPSQRAALEQLLADYNETQVGAAPEAFLAVLLRHPETDAITGGLWGVSAFDWLFIELLFVPAELRRQGVGWTLMRKAEEIAVARGCRGVRLDTFSFQAPAFYEKLGYRALGRLRNSPKAGFDRIFLFKALSSEVPPL